MRCYHVKHRVPIHLRRLRGGRIQSSSTPRRARRRAATFAVDQRIYMHACGRRDTYGQIVPLAGWFIQERRARGLSMRARGPPCGRHRISLHSIPCVRSYPNLLTVNTARPPRGILGSHSFVHPRCTAYPNSTINTSSIPAYGPHTATALLTLLLHLLRAS